MHRFLNPRPYVSAAALAATAFWLPAPPAQAALEIGVRAPDFTIEAALGGRPFRFSLADALARGPVVVYFFPKAFTEGCTIEAHSFAQAMPDYTAAGASVIGISGDDIATMSRFSTEACRDTFPVGSDSGGKVMNAYDAAMPRASTPRRISYVVGRDGRIAFVHESASPQEHVPRTLDAVRSLKR